MASAALKPGIAFDVYGSEVSELQNLIREAAFIVVALVSLWPRSPDEHRAANGVQLGADRGSGDSVRCHLRYDPIPVEAMLSAGSNGAFFRLFVASRHRARWRTSREARLFLSSQGPCPHFLDNAPDVPCFLRIGGWQPLVELMGPLAGTLASISMGAVYMGALTYIGNAPNFMVYAIAEENGIRMPSFFGYMALGRHRPGSYSCVAHIATYCATLKAVRKGWPDRCRRG